MTSAETVDAAALRSLAGRFVSDVGSHLDDARAALSTTASIEYPNFTAIAWTLAMAYVEADNFANRDLLTKRDTVASYGVALKKTADDWEAAEKASTQKPHGN